MMELTIDGAMRPAEGDEPLFPNGLPLARPRVANPEAVTNTLVEILRSGVLTNGPHVRRLETRAAEYLGVRYCVAVASCTAGLMLVLRASGISGDVIVPSFTFAATVHAVAWNGLRPVFADIDPRTLTLSVEATDRSVGVRTGAILATHTFGTPADVEGLKEVADRSGIRLFFDAAHAFGSRRDGRMIGGFGDAEVFSLSPTKVLIAGEGGVIATDDERLAERCRIGRDYGNPGDYDCRFVGLNARMSELHAAVALASFEDLEERIEERGRLAAAYRRDLADVPGISFPNVAQQDRSTFKDMVILVDEASFGLAAAELGAALAAEGVETRRYYAPPVHTMHAYRSMGPVNRVLPVTDRAARMALTLPLWSGLTQGDVETVGRAIREARPSASGNLVASARNVQHVTHAQGRSGS